MNRMEEYELLRRQLSAPPEALEGSIDRVKARIQKRRRLRRRIQVPATSIAAAFAAFVLLVNVYTPFAQACASIPLLKPLVEAVSVNPSLETALEHNYVQGVLASQTVGEFTVTVDAMIVDEAEIDIFYHIDCPKNTYETIYTDGGNFLVSDGDGQKLPAFVTYDTEMTPGDPVFCTISFGQNAPLPDTVHFTLVIQQAVPVNGSGRESFPKEDYTVTFDLPIGNAEVAQSKIYNVQKWVEIDDQRIFIDRVDVHPTHARVYVKDDPENTAWLEMLYCTLRDESGNEAGKINNGLIASGSMESKEYPFAVHLESPYFWDSEHLTLDISGADWLDKEKQYTTFDLSTGFAQTPLPPSVYSARVYRERGTLYIGSVAKEQDDYGMYPIIPTAFHDHPGDMDIPGFFASAYPDQFKELLYVPEGYFISELALPNYAYDDTVTVRWHHTHESNLDEPLHLYLS